MSTGYKLRLLDYSRVSKLNISKDQRKKHWPYYKSHYLTCVQHENQNGVAYGCRVSTRNVGQSQILKVTELQYLTVYSINDFNLYLFSNSEGKTKSNQLILCLCQRSLRQRNAFNSFT